MKYKNLLKKLIILFFIFLVLSLNNAFGDDDNDRPNIAKRISDAQKISDAESSPNINLPAKPDKGGRSQSILLVKARADPVNVTRGKYIKIVYFLECQGHDLSLDNIVVNFPEEFEYISSENKNIINSERGNSPKLSGKLERESHIELIFNAKISLNSPLKIYNISKFLNYNKIVYSSNATLKVENNPPEIYKLNVNSYPSPLSDDGNETVLFAESNASFECSIFDKERNGIELNISIKDLESNLQIWNRSIKDYISKTEYGRVLPGRYSMNIFIKDVDGGKLLDQRYITVIDKTYQQDFAEDFWPYIVLILTFLIFILIWFRLDRINCSRIIESHWDNVIRKAIIILLIFWLMMPELTSGLVKIDFLAFILVIYLLISILAIGLLEINFPYDSAKLKCVVPDRGFIKKIIYILTKSALTLAVVICMTISLLIVGFSLPFNLPITGIETHYSYIFYYYSSIIQLFGTILSIVSMFIIWYMQDNNKDSTLKKHKESIFKMLKDFMFLYISVILLSLCGLALERFPELNVAGKMESFVDCSAVFIFESTMLLVAPAMAALFSLATSFMEILAEQPGEKDPESKTLVIKAKFKRTKNRDGST